MADRPTHRLFSYGTLRDAQVQQALFGRRLTGEADVLPGYAVAMVAVGDPAVVATSGAELHPMVSRTGNDADGIEGVVFALREDDLAAADRYETSAYARVTVRLRSGREAFVYVDAKDSP